MATRDLEIRDAQLRARREFLIAKRRRTCPNQRDSVRASDVLDATLAMNPRLKLGFDNYAVRALGWKAPQLLDHAASLRLDSVLLSDLNVYESRSDGYLRELKAKAEALGVEIQVGMLSICPSSVMFNPARGGAEEQLQLTMRIAMTLGSPIVRCVLGEVRDRRSPGGIEARIAETVQVLKRVRRRALDCGVKVAVENHAGDMQSWELVTLIEAAGPDFVGATLDSGNAAWALEHPAESLEILGPYALSSGIRDCALWEAADGAILQWTAMGEGCVDWPAYFKRFAQICPETPVHLETISGRPIAIPFWNDSFWEAYRAVRPFEFIKFLKLVHEGKPRAAFADADTDGEYQLAQLAQSVRYCKNTLGLGRKDAGTGQTSH
jgi:3-oxoisoapionate decarboxylase